MLHANDLKRLALMGVRFETDPGAPGTGGNKPDPGTDPNKADPPKPTDPNAPKPDDKDGKPTEETQEQIVARLQSEVQRLEREKAAVRIQKEGELKNEAKRQELLSLAKLAGVEVKDPDKETLATLTEKLTGKVVQGDQTTEELQNAKLELAIYKTAGLADVKVDPDKLANRVSFVKAAAALDLSADDFSEKLKAAILAEAQNDPSIKIGGTGSSASGADQYGGAGGGQVDKERFAKMNVSERTALFRSNPALYEQLANG